MDLEDQEGAMSPGMWVASMLQEAMKQIPPLGLQKEYSHTNALVLDFWLPEM